MIMTVFEGIYSIFLVPSNCCESGDVLVYVDGQCVLGYSHQDIIRLFQSIPVGETVTIDICRGYPLPFNPDDPNNEIITTVAVTSSSTSADNT